VPSLLLLRLLLALSLLLQRLLVQIQSCKGMVCWDFVIAAGNRAMEQSSSQILAARTAAATGEWAPAMLCELQCTTNQIKSMYHPLSSSFRGPGFSLDLISKVYWEIERREWMPRLDSFPPRHVPIPVAQVCQTLALAPAWGTSTNNSSAPARRKDVFSSRSSNSVAPAC
jgi:hypothetical protein